MVEEIANNRDITLLPVSESDHALLRSRSDWFICIQQGAYIAARGLICITSYGVEEGYAWIDVYGMRRIKRCYITANCSLATLLEFQMA